MSILNFSGRTRIKDYWLGLLYWYVVPPLFVALVALVLLGINFMAVLLIFVTPLPWLYFLVISVARLAITARRCNDAGVSPLFCLLTLVPVLQFFPTIVIGLLPSKKNVTYIETEEVKIKALEVKNLEIEAGNSITKKFAVLSDTEEKKYIKCSAILNYIGLWFLVLSVFQNYIDFFDVRINRLVLVELVNVASKAGNYEWVVEIIIVLFVSVLNIINSFVYTIYDFICIIIRPGHDAIIMDYASYGILSGFDTEKLNKSLHLYNTFVSNGSLFIIIAIGCFIAAVLFDFKVGLRFDAIAICLILFGGIYLNIEILDKILPTIESDELEGWAFFRNFIFKICFSLAYTAWDYFIFLSQLIFILGSFFTEQLNGVFKEGFLPWWNNTHKAFEIVSNGSLLWFVIWPINLLQYWFNPHGDESNDERESPLLLGMRYHFGKGVNQNLGEAIKYYKLAADDDAAQLGLGVIYGMDNIVFQDYAESHLWLDLSAKQGNSLAQFYLASCYYYGKGVARDFREAAQWFESCMNQRNLGSEQTNEAAVVLATMYYDGNGVIQDYARSHMWYNVASANGHERAAMNRDILASKMTPQQIADAQELARNFQSNKSR